MLRIIILVVFFLKCQCDKNCTRDQTKSRFEFRDCNFLICVKENHHGEGKEKDEGGPF